MHRVPRKSPRHISIAVKRGDSTMNSGVPSIRNEKRAIVTITMGDHFWAMAALTHPLMRHYAERCGANFIVLDHPRLSEKLGTPKYERLQLFHLLEQYDRAIFFDTDILVAKDAPDLFAIVPASCLGVASEEPYVMSSRDKEVTQEILGKVDWRSDYFNSGMMVLSREHKALFDPDNPDLKLWATGDFRKLHINLLNDQPFLNHRVNKLGINVMDLGYRYNHTRTAMRKTHLRFRSHIIHYAGASGHRYGPELHQLRKDAAVLTNPFLLWLSKHAPAYRWIADRFDQGFIEYLVRRKFARRKP
jgi:hypothetical protein